METGQSRDFVVGIGTLALINAGLAQSKQRSGLAWFFLSCVLGPIATLLLVSAYRHPPAPAALPSRERAD